MENLVLVIVGVVLIFMGISHRKGNISSLHSYHRKRVSEADRIPFGKEIGLGTIIIGASAVIGGGVMYLAGSLQQEIYTTVAYIIFGLGLVVGLAISFHAMIKYNKGIF